MTDFPITVNPSGSKVDELLLDGEQEELHPKVKALSDVCEEANCTGFSLHRPRSQKVGGQ